MAKIRAVPLDRPDVAPRELSARLRSQLVYFMSSPGEPGVPALGPNEYWFRAADVALWYDDGTFQLVSPLDTQNMAVIEITEEQEDLLGWLRDKGIQHVRIDE